METTTITVQGVQERSGARGPYVLIFSEERLPNGKNSYFVKDAERNYAHWAERFRQQVN